MRAKAMGENEEQEGQNRRGKTSSKKWSKDTV